MQKQQRSPDWMLCKGVAGGSPPLVHSVHFFCIWVFPHCCAYPLWAAWILNSYSQPSLVVNLGKAGRRYPGASDSVVSVIEIFPLAFWLKLKSSLEPHRVVGEGDRLRLSPAGEHAAPSMRWADRPSAAQDLNAALSKGRSLKVLNVDL